MKLVVALGIEEHAAHIRNIFREHHVLIYSEAPVGGVQSRAEGSDPGNWFASRPDGIFSHLLFAFVDDGAAGKLLDALHDWNERELPTNPVHAFVLGVERSV